MKKNTIKLLTIATLATTTLFTSCYTSKIAHGNLTVESPVVEVNSKKQHALISGLIPLKPGYKATDFVGDKENYITKHQMTFVDGLLGVITFGIYTPTTVFFYVPLDSK